MKTLKGKVILLIIVISALPLVLLSLYNIILSYNKTVEDVNTLLQTRNENSKNFIENYVVDLSSMLNYLSNDANVQGAYANANDERKWMLVNFQNVYESYNQVRSVYIGLKDKNMLIKPDQQLPSDYDPTIRPWYKGAVQNRGKVFITDPYEDASTGDTLITMSKAIVSDGEVVGVLGLDLSMKTLVNVISQETNYKTAYSFIVNDKGITMIHPNSENIGSDVSNQEFFTKKQGNSGQIDYMYENVKKDAHYSTIDGTSWIVYSVVDEKEILQEPLNKLITMTIFAVVVIVLAFILGIVFIRRVITNPISRLSENINKF